MRFFKGYAKDCKKKPGRIILVLISKHADIISENKRPGDIIIQDGVYYAISQLIEGEPRHYDTDDIRIKTFEICLNKLKELLKDTDIKEIAIQHWAGSYTNDQWINRKNMLKEFEKNGYEISVYVPVDNTKKNDDDIDLKN